MGEGAPVLARLSKAPVLLVGLACRPALTLNSWDKAKLPLPFGRGAIVWDGPHGARDGDDLEALGGQWAARLSRATQSAEAALA